MLKQYLGLAELSPIGTHRAFPGNCRTMRCSGYLGRRDGTPLVRHLPGIKCGTISPSSPLSKAHITMSDPGGSFGSGNSPVEPPVLRADAKR